MVKKFLIWTCRDCGLKLKSPIPQDPKKIPENSRFFTCQDCILKKSIHYHKLSKEQLTIFK
jgi:hypothetical protein